MGVAASLPRRAARPWARLSALARVGAAPLVAGMVVVSTLLRGLAGALKETPVYFQDEYLYAELARSLAETGRPLVRGAEANFPALLQPILTAPAWLLDDVASAYGLVKWIGALAISLAAVPAFVLSRRLGLSTSLAFGVAALTLATPSLFYSSWVMGEPFAYPLTLAALAVGTVALAEGRPRPQLAFLLLAGLAALSRAQLLVLVFCYLAGMLLLALRERALRRVLREQALVLVLGVTPLALALVVMPGRLLGAYGSTGIDTPLSELPGLLGRNALGVAYASGWILVPGAVLGLAFALGRYRSRAELAFVSLAIPFGLLVLLQSSLFGDVGRIQERYTFYLVPVVGLAFGLFASRAWPARRAHAVVAAVALASSAAVPLAFHADDAAKTQSAFLFGVHRLEQLFGSEGSGSLAVAVAVAALSTGVGLLALRPRIATPVALTLALCFCAAASALAADFDRRNTSAVRDSFLPADPSWVDTAGVGEVALVRGLGLKTDAMEQLFWNRSLERVLLLPGATPFDSFGAEPLTFGPDGALLAGGQPVLSALLIDEWATRVELRGASAVASSPGFRLWQPHGVPRLAQYVLGYYQDGWLAMRTGLNAWPRPGAALAGRFSFVVSAPEYLPAPVTLRVEAGGRRLLTFRLRPGESRPLQVPACGKKAWLGTLFADRGMVLGNRVVSARSTPPRFTADPAACR